MFVFNPKLQLVSSAKCPFVLLGELSALATSQSKHFVILAPAAAATAASDAATGGVSLRFSAAPSVASASANAIF